MCSKKFGQLIEYFLNELSSIYLIPFFLTQIIKKNKIPMDKGSNLTTNKNNHIQANIELI